MKYDLNDLQVTVTESPTYNLQGMSCQGCANKVQNHLNQLSQVRETTVDKVTDTVQLSLIEKLTLSQLNESLKALDPKYVASPVTSHLITQQETGSTQSTHLSDTPHRSWLATYKPILLIFGFLVLVTGTIQVQSLPFDLSTCMRHFMAGFFLIFSFFKLLNLKGFALSYQMYDVVAGKWSGWGYAYPFVELGLGLAYLSGFNPLITNSIALVVMSVSIVGVLRSVLNRQRIQCACLGDVFNLPMSTVTIIEDGMMILMSGWMLLTYL